MDRLRRYVCAFTHAVGIESTTESCKDGMPAPEEGTTRSAPGSGVITVDLLWSDAPSSWLDGERPDRGVY
jgi:hypothetical protein